MGLFDFLKSDKKREHQAAEKAKEQRERRAQAGPAAKAATDRMAAPAPPKAPAAMPPRPTGPAMPTPASAAHKAVPVPPTSAASAHRRTYTVKTGDSLSSIARHELGNEGRWRELYAINERVIGSNPDMIQPGMVLTLPG